MTKPKLTKSLMAFAAVLVLSFTQSTVDGASASLAEKRLDDTAAEVMSDVCGLKDVVCEQEWTIEERIVDAATKAQIDVRAAVRIAKCESSLNPQAKSDKSSATGLYQFTKGTWKWIGAEAAGLDRTNPDHSIAMFLKIYPKYPHYWECK